MGKCIYCGENAGFFSNKHKDCELKFNQGQVEYVDEIISSIIGGDDYDSLKQKLNNISKSNYIGKNLQNDLKAKAFDLVVEQFLEDGILSPYEEEKIDKFKDDFQLTQDTIDKNGSYMKVVMSSIIRDLTEGKEPEQKININGQLPFIFQKSETLIWFFNNVELYEQRTRTEYEGGSQGFSVRIAKGLYYRTSSFRGRPVKISEISYVDSGLVALTTKHLYFGSSAKKFKIPFDKLISIEPYEDGIGLHKDGVTAKQQVFKNLDGWFVHNVISNLIN